MNLLYSALQFIPLLEIVLRVILYIGVIYILFGPLRKLIKAVLIHLESQRINASDSVITTEIASEKTEQQLTTEE